jgi:predicted N-formylglutamate amidohydrolase
VIWKPLISVEHASNAIPDELEKLGLSDEIIESHVAWDPGAKEVGSHLATVFNAPLFLSQYSRLVADLNRSPENHESVPAHAFGVDVPGNTKLSAAAIAERLKKFHSPYWNRIGTEIENTFSAGQGCLHFGVHSFTEVYEGQYRDVDIGLLVDPEHIGDGPLTKLVFEHLKQSGLDCRINEPYSGLNDGLSTNLRNRYCNGRYASIEFEFNHRHLHQLPKIAQVIEAAIRASGYLDRLV